MTKQILIDEDTVKLALKELETWKRFTHGENEHTNKAIKVLEEALAKQEQGEPVAWMQDSIELYVQDRPSEYYTIPLYTHPQPKREPLTDDERFQLRCQWNPEIHGALHDYLIQQTEAAHGIKE